ncbi:MAG TPA: ABC transporter transmembrane domain-containing protein, partial [Roseiflexaceae bacterium]|nr:ABC transporter transmembrane domain-containing protein [Roseiflexaceae bacterium]
AVFEAYPLAYLIDFLQGNRPDLPAFFGLPAIVSPLIDTVALLTTGIVLMAMINSLADSLAEIYLARGGRALGYNLRVEIYSHLQRLSLAFHDKRRTGDVLTRVTGDVAALEDFVIGSLSDIVGSLLVLVGTMAFLVSQSWEVALVGAVIIPIMAGVSNYFSQRIKAATKKQRACEGDLASSAQEMLTSIRVIQTYSRAGHELKRFARHTQRAREAALVAAGLQARFSWVVKVLEALAISIVVWLGLWLIGQSALTIGTLVLFIILIQNMFKPTRKIIREWNTIGKVYASVERIGELLDRRPTVVDLPGAVEAPPFRGEVVFRAVSFAYQPDPEEGPERGVPPLALRDISFSIAPGKVLALVGHTGAGKSTIAQLLPRLYDPSAGEILIDGRTIRDYTIDSLRAQISVVLQETILFSGSVAENIAYGRPEASMEEIVAAATQANAHEFITRLPDGYDTLLGERGANLSGGQRQRIAIARAFIRNTPILILDEPTTGLDVEAAEQVLLALRTLMKGKTTIIISHDLKLIRHADTIVVIKEGAIEQVGTHQELLDSDGLYAGLYRKQFGEHGPGQGRDGAAPSESGEGELPTAELDAPQPAAAARAGAETLSVAGSPDTDAPADGTAPVALPAAESPDTAAVANGVPVTIEAGSPDTVTAVEEAPETDAPADGTAPVAPPAAESPGPATNGVPAAPHVVSDGATHEPAAATLGDLLQNPTVQRELPGLAAAFAAEAIRAQLQDALFDGTCSDYTIERCAPGKATYLPGDSCVLRYDLEVRNGASGEVTPALLNARVFPDQERCAAYVRERLEPLAEQVRAREELALFGAPLATLGALNLAVSVFPIDGDLPTLVGATDRQRMLDIFRSLPALTADGFVAEDCQVELGHYGRRHRCVLRYALEGRLPGGRRAERRIVYGKVASDDRGAISDAAVGQLRERLRDAGDGERFHIPQALGFLPDLRLALLEAIPGQPQVSKLLKARLNGTPVASGLASLEEALAAAARMAATLHSSGIALGPRRALTDELERLGRDVAAIVRVSPELGQRLRGWLERAGAASDPSDALAFCFSHGDFTHTQLVFEGTASGLVDFDTVCQAEPALDLGHFLAYLRLAAMRAQWAGAHEAPAQVEPLCERFLEAYIEAARDGLEDREQLRLRIAVYEVVSLLRMAVHSWQKLKGSRLAYAVAMLEERVACLPQLSH